MRFPLLCVCFGLLTFSSAPAQSIFLVRHAERADADEAAQPDPALSPAGENRAQTLAQTLRDAKIETIFVTEFRRTKETAQPLAEKLGLQPVVVSAQDTAGLVAKLKLAHGNVLVVGHSNTLPEIMKSLGAPTPAALDEKDYDNLFVLQIEPTPHWLRLHY